MANFNKAFNFRGGFQVDEDTFLVRGQNVGIGSSVPAERLDVDGVVKARGLIVDSTDTVAITSVYVGFVSATEIQAGIFTGTPENGGIATYYGDGVNLLNLPTSQWLDIDVGLGFTSIYAQGNVGVDTTDPRYAFQVGGVPFKTKTGPFLEAQDGIGIEDGNMYFSGIVSARYKPSLEKQGFVGYGSYIHTLNATELTTGAIPPNAYDDLIITEEVRAPRLTGIASTAISVTPDATLSFDTAVANELKALNRFISTEGYVQIGTDEDVSYVGDIEVVKSTDKSRIYSISSDDTSFIMVGQERQAGSNRQFGGLRKGLLPSQPATGDTDLDIVNYDTGNLNYYLHSGSGGQGATTGKFRWLYGQRNIVLMDLDKDGRLSLPTNALVTDALFTVGGNSQFNGDVTISGSGELSCVGVATFGSDVTVFGELNAGTIVLSGIVTFTGVDAGSVLVGADPTLGGSGATIQPNLSNFHNKLTVTESTGDVSVTDNLDVGGLVDANTINCVGFTFSGNVVGPAGFLIASDGSLTAPTITATTNITAGGIIDGDSIVGLTGNITTLTIGDLNGTRVDVSEVETDSLNVVNTSTVNDLSAQSIETLSFLTDTATVSTLDVTDANVTTLHAGIGTKVDVSDNLNLQGNDIESVGEITADTVTADFVDSFDGEYGTGGGNKVKIEYQQRTFGSDTLPAIVFEMFDSSNVSLGQTFFQLFTLEE